MTEVAEAAAEIERHTPAWPSEILPIDACTGRVLRQVVHAERDLPAFDRVTMDGVAINSAAVANGERRFVIAGTQPAGSEALAISDRKQCIRVMTGAICPAGADSVVPVERVQLDGDVAIVDEDVVVAAGQYIHRQGSDRRAGSVVLEPGIGIGPAEMAVLASVGQARVEVAKLPRVAVVSTGDELVGVADPIEPYQIRSSNGRAVEAALTRHGLAHVRRARLKDDQAELLAALDLLHRQSDVLILSGGVSMGDFDFVPAVLKQLRCELIFHRINQKPGKPMWFGISDAGKPIFALPGNPVSTLVCMTRYVLPAIRRAMGASDTRTERVKLAQDIADGPSRMTYFVPVTLGWSAAGDCLAVPRAINTSGDFSSLAGTDGIVELTTDSATRREGAAVPLYRW